MHNLPQLCAPNHVQNALNYHVRVTAGSSGSRSKRGGSSSQRIAHPLCTLRDLYTTLGRLFAGWCGIDEWRLCYCAVFVGLGGAGGGGGFGAVCVHVPERLLCSTWARVLQ